MGWGKLRRAKSPSSLMNKMHYGIYDAFVIEEVIEEVSMIRYSSLTCDSCVK